MKSLTEQLRHRMTEYIINNRTNIKAMWEQMKPSFSYETLRNFYKNNTSARGYVLDEIDEFLREQKK